MNVRMHLNIGVGVDIECVEKKNHPEYEKRFLFFAIQLASIHFG